MRWRKKTAGHVPPRDDRGPNIVVVKPGDMLFITNLKSIGAEDTIDPQQLADLSQQLMQFAGLYGCFAVGEDADAKDLEHLRRGVRQ